MINSRSQNITVVKIGGSTLGSGDTTVKDLVSLQQRGLSLVVVHGGGNIVSSWLKNLKVENTFINGLRVTDTKTLEVVVAVLAGLINKQIVSDINAMGGMAWGLCGIDASLIKSKQIAPGLGMVGEVTRVVPDPLFAIINMGFIPVIAPVCLAVAQNVEDKENILNVNADSVAAALASSLKANKLLFLTDVEGILDQSGKLISFLTAEQLSDMVMNNIAAGGMAVKAEACLQALETVSLVKVIDGRKSGILIEEMTVGAAGTTIILEKPNG